MGAADEAVGVVHSHIPAGPGVAVVPRDIGQGVGAGAGIQALGGHGLVGRGLGGRGVGDGEEGGEQDGQGQGEAQHSCLRVGSPAVEVFRPRAFLLMRGMERFMVKPF